MGAAGSETTEGRRGLSGRWKPDWGMALDFAGEGSEPSEEPAEGMLMERRFVFRMELAREEGREEGGVWASGPGESGWASSRTTAI